MLNNLFSLRINPLWFNGISIKVTAVSTINLSVSSFVPAEEVFDFQSVYNYCYQFYYCTKVFAVQSCSVIIVYICYAIYVIKILLNLFLPSSL